MGYKERFRNPIPPTEEVVDKIVEETVEDVLAEESSETPVSKVEPKHGVVSHCATLNIRETPELFMNNVKKVVPTGTELTIDPSESTNDWFKVRTKDGIEGFCMKKYVSVK